MKHLIRSIVEWSAVLLVALAATLLLTSAAAYAECAWVLWAWSEWDEKHGKSWESEGVWPNRQPCIDELAGQRFAAEIARDQGRATLVEQPRMLILTVTHFVPPGEQPGRIWGNTFKFRCLPDTIDPRSPKAR